MPCTQMTCGPFRLGALTSNVCMVVGSIEKQNFGGQERGIGAPVPGAPTLSRNHSACVIGLFVVDVMVLLTVVVSPALPGFRSLVLVATETTVFGPARGPDRRVVTV